MKAFLIILSILIVGCSEQVQVPNFEEGVCEADPVGGPLKGCPDYDTNPVLACTQDSDCDCHGQPEIYNGCKCTDGSCVALFRSNSS